ncbi:MAG TPA: branched-chain amino acid aminotransferase [Halalkalibaculum sp.]|nr:branched-chain amino acid aminotransferase [Halalkalibaculum sp.]
MDTLTDIAVQKAEQSRLAEVDLDNPGFGKVFTDHMLEMEYRDGEWKQPVIKPYGPIQITPALSTLHYGQSVFEGTKAYYIDGETVNLFRPEKNYERMVNSCERLCIPKIDRETFLEGIRQLVKLDHKWVPEKDGNSLYIRPFACAWDAQVAAKVSDTYRFYIILSPVGSYYNAPVRLITSQNYVRAVEGGFGEAKTAGNYAASFYPARKAQSMGFSQVLWLDAFEHEYVEEVGTMNIFFFIDDVLITPPLGGTILPGVTRDSVLKLARSWDMNVEERKIGMTEVMDAANSGKLQEVFGAGTAAVIAPVKEIRHHGELISIHEDGRGPVGQKLYDTIYGIQRGKVEDPFNWTHHITVG